MPLQLKLKVTACKKFSINHSPMHRPFLPSPKGVHFIHMILCPAMATAVSEVCSGLIIQKKFSKGARSRNPWYSKRSIGKCVKPEKHSLGPSIGATRITRDRGPSNCASAAGNNPCKSAFGDEPSLHCISLFGRSVDSVIHSGTNREVDLANWVANCRHGEAVR